jgi:hypothetical protein
MGTGSVRARLIGLALVCSVAIGVVVAQAQPKTKPPAAKVEKAEKVNKTDKSEKKQTERASEEEDDDETVEKAPEGDDDLGDPPPPREKEVEQEKRPSPLTPEPEEFPSAGAQPPLAEYDALLSEIAALRGRVTALTKTLFKSRLRVLVETDGDDARIDSLVITLDDGVVFTAKAGFVAEDPRTVYEHPVAPGHHVVGIEIERHDARGKEFKTWQTSKFSVIVPEAKYLEAQIELEDDSGMASDFPDDQDGEYDLRVRLRAQVKDE